MPGKPDARKDTGLFLISERKTGPMTKTVRSVWTYDASLINKPPGVARSLFISPLPLMSGELFTYNTAA